MQNMPVIYTTKVVTNQIVKFGQNSACILGKPDKVFLFLALAAIS
jgi:hypothetical protein